MDLNKKNPQTQITQTKLDPSYKQMGGKDEQNIFLSDKMLETTIHIKQTQININKT